MGQFQKEVPCKQCGEMFLRHGPKKVFCSPRCRWAHQSAIIKEKDPSAETVEFMTNPNKMARWMGPHICLWFLEGMSVKQIASMTMRPQTQIRKILACKEDMDEARSMMLLRKETDFPWGHQELV